MREGGGKCKRRNGEDWGVEVGNERGRREGRGGRREVSMLFAHT